jgi:RNA polymerase sigma factor (sigma-70 family)
MHKMQTLAREIDQTDLINACKAGDSAAQRQLYNLYARPMFGVCHRLLKHREEAEDVLQESFVAAFQSIHSFRNDSTFGAWMKRIVINKSINQLRKKKLVFEQVLDYAEEVDFEEHTLSVDLIKEAMNNMPEGYRLVFSLYYFENLSHKEIAQELEISEGTSKSQLNRAKQFLKKKIEENGYGKG